MAEKDLGLCSSKVGLLLIDEVLPFEILPSLDCPYPGTCPFDSDLPTVGLDGRPGLTSFAYTNIGELSGLIVLVTEFFRSNKSGLDEVEEPGPSLITLDALDLRPAFETLNPSPLVACAFLLGVPFGVPFGVDDALSTLAFLDPDRGVMLELRKALTGVATSSGKCPLSRPSPSTRLSFRRAEDPFIAGDAAILGVPSLFPAHLGDCIVAFAIGRRLTMPVFFSEFIAAAPCRMGVAEKLYRE